MSFTTIRGTKNINCRRSAYRQQCARAHPSSGTRSVQARVFGGKEASIDKYQALQSTPVFRVTDGEKVLLPSLWDDNELAAVVFARSFGCPFCQEMARQLSREFLPQFSNQDCKLFLVSIGTPETGREFAKTTNFPPEQLFADPQNATYDALKLKKGLLVTWTSPLTPIAIAQRAIQNGTKDMQDVLKDWTPWQPPKGVEQSLNQGGTFLFEGATCFWEHYDLATAAHANFGEVLEQVKQRRPAPAQSMK